MSDKPEVDLMLRDIRTLANATVVGGGNHPDLRKTIEQFDQYIAALSQTKTKLIIADEDKPKAFLELSDEALGRFCRAYLIRIEQALHRHAGNTKLPVPLATSMHGCIAMYRMALEANAAELVLEHSEVTWGGKERGDWEMTLRQIRQPDEVEEHKQTDAHIRVNRCTTEVETEEDRRKADLALSRLSPQKGGA